ncbi:MAG: DUF3667 domain-containing protein [bacterium]
MQEQKSCPNCGADLNAVYCSNCGQKSKNFDVPFKELVSDVFADIFTLDSRFLRTLVPLMTKPGFLTTEYNSGRRTRYMPPLRLYLFVSFLLFFVLAMTDVRMVKFSATPTKANATAMDSLTTARQMQLPDSLDTTAKLRRKFLYKLRQEQQNLQQINKTITNRLPQLMFVLMPIFAGLLKLLYRRKGLYYFSHLIFAIHFHTFAFLLLFLVVLIFVVSNSGGGVPLIAGIPIYLFLGMRRVYEESWWQSKAAKAGDSWIRLFSHSGFFLFCPGYRDGDVFLAIIKRSEQWFPISQIASRLQTFDFKQATTFSRC